MGVAGPIPAVLVVISVILVSVYSAAIDNSITQEGISLTRPQTFARTERSIQQCGPRLRELVRTICRNVIFTGYNRRSAPSSSAGMLSEDSQDLGGPMGNNLDAELDSLLSSYGDAGVNADRDVENTMSTDWELLWPLTSKSLALTVLTDPRAHQRFRRNISEECCKKPCNVSYIKTYCGGNRTF